MSVSTSVFEQHMIKMATCAIFYCFCCCVNHNFVRFVLYLLVINSACSLHARAEIMLAPLKIFYRRKTRSNLVLHFFFFFWKKKFNWTPFNLFGMMAITTTHENVFFQHSILKWNIVCNKVKYHEAFEKAFFQKVYLRT